MAGALASHPNLRALNLSDNALGEKGIRAFAAGLANKVRVAVPCQAFHSEPQARVLWDSSVLH